MFANHYSFFFYYYLRSVILFQGFDNWPVWLRQGFLCKPQVLALGSKSVHWVLFNKGGREETYVVVSDFCSIVFKATLKSNLQALCFKFILKFILLHEREKGDYTLIYCFTPKCLQQPGQSWELGTQPGCPMWAAAGTQ